MRISFSSSVRIFWPKAWLKKHFSLTTIIKQEIIPVECLPPARHPVRGGVSVPGGLPDRDPTGQIPPGTGTSLWTETTWTETPLGLKTETPPGRNMEPVSQTGSDIIQRPPTPVNRMTDASKNITLPQTSLAGANCWHYISFQFSWGISNNQPKPVFPSESSVGQEHTKKEDSTFFLVCDRRICCWIVDWTYV